MEELTAEEIRKKYLYKERGTYDNCEDTFITILD
jgi:hypothetical protein